jgi:hypothetical protein
MINTEDATAIKTALSHLIALKDAPENGEYLNGAISLAESFHAMLSNRGDSKAYESAYNTIKSMGRNMKSLKIDRENNSKNH